MPIIVAFPAFSSLDILITLNTLIAKTTQTTLINM